MSIILDDDLTGVEIGFTVLMHKKEGSACLFSIKKNQQLKECYKCV